MELDNIMKRARKIGGTSATFELAIQRRREGMTYEELKSIYGNEAAGVTAAVARRWMVGELIHTARNVRVYLSKKQAAEMLMKCRGTANGGGDMK